MKVNLIEKQGEIDTNIFIFKNSNSLNKFRINTRLVMIKNTNKVI